MILSSNHKLNNTRTGRGICPDLSLSINPPLPDSLKKASPPSSGMEGSLESELDDELGYEPYDVKNKATANSRNGHSKKTLRTSMGCHVIETAILSR